MILVLFGLSIQLSFVISRPFGPCNSIFGIGEPARQRHPSHFERRTDRAHDHILRLSAADDESTDEHILGGPDARARRDVRETWRIEKTEDADAIRGPDIDFPIRDRRNDEFVPDSRNGRDR